MCLSVFLCVSLFTSIPSLYLEKDLFLFLHCVAMYDPNNSCCSAEDSPTTPDAKMSRNKFNLQLPPGAVIAVAASAEDSSPASICDE